MLRTTFLIIVIFCSLCCIGSTAWAGTAEVGFSINADGTLTGTAFGTFNTVYCCSIWGCQSGGAYYNSGTIALYHTSNLFYWDCYKLGYGSETCTHIYDQCDWVGTHTFVAETVDYPLDDPSCAGPAEIVFSDYYTLTISDNPTVTITSPPGGSVPSPVDLSCTASFLPTRYSTKGFINVYINDGLFDFKTCDSDPCYYSYLESRGKLYDGHLNSTVPVKVTFEAISHCSPARTKKDVYICGKCCNGQTDENCKGGGCDGSSGNTNSIDIGSSANLFSGNLYETHEIIPPKGSGLPINFTLSYNSLDTTSGPLGKGWTHNYNENIATGPNSTLIYAKRDGKRVYYYNAGPSVFKALPVGDESVLTKNADNTYTLTEKSGLTRSFGADGKLSSIADREGHAVNFTYTNGKLTGIADSFARSVTITYNPDGTISTITDPSDPGRFTSMTYQSGYLRYITDPSGNTREYQYWTDGKLKAKVDPDPRVVPTTYTYYANGKVQSSTNAIGIKTLSYDTANNTVTVTERDGGIWTYKYDKRLQVPLEVTDPLGTKTISTYNPNNRKILSETKQFMDNGIQVEQTTSYIYESNGDTVVTDPMGNVTTYSKNAYDQITAIRVTDPQDNQVKTTTFGYDIQTGRLTSITDPLQNTTTISEIDSVKTVTDPKGNLTIYTNDARGNLQTVEDALHHLTTYEYWPDEKLKSVTDANSHSINYSYEYDPTGWLKKMTGTDQLGKSDIYEYDRFGDLSAYTDRKGQKTTYEYYEKGRLKKATYQDQSFTEYGYDSLQRLQTITDSVSGTISYEYSGITCGAGCSGGSSSKITKETTPQGSISYTYDNIGIRKTMTVLDQPTVNYTYNFNNVLTDIDTIINGASKNFHIQPDSLSRRDYVTYPNGVTTDYSFYDDASRLLDLRHLDPTSAVLESLTYTYDPNGNRTSMDRPSVNPQVPSPASSITYNGANQMLTFNTTNIVYDDNGNMTSVTNSCGTTTYTWDVRNRLIGISGFKPDCSALTASFQYDALGRRIQKTINGRTITYLYDGLDIVQEIENGIPSVNYIRTLNIDEPLARVELATNTVRYYHADALGSVIGLSDENGQMVTTYAYDPFGKVSITGEISDNPFQFTGRENDKTGLYYYRARYYSPELQRFISEDPIGLRGGDGDLYAYVRNNPVNYVDPKGLFPWWIVPPVAVGCTMVYCNVWEYLTCMEDCTGISLPRDPIRTPPPPNFGFCSNKCMHHIEKCHWLELLLHLLH